MTANISSTACRVSVSVSGVVSFRVLLDGVTTGIDSRLVAERERRPGDGWDGAVLVDVRVVAAKLLSEREWVVELSSAWRP